MLSKKGKKMTSVAAAAKKQRIQSMASSNQDVSGLPSSVLRNQQQISDEVLTSAPRIQNVTVELPTSYDHGLTSFYVRDCYDEYYMRVMDMLNDLKYISVTGTPGIGKSIFYDYFFARYRKEHPNVSIVTASFNKDRGLEECVVFGPDGSSEIWENTDFPNISKRIPNAIHLYDGPPSIEPARSKMVSFTSPSFGWLDSMTKNRFHRTLYMPVWEEEELNEAMELLHLEITNPPLNERYQLFGGIPRDCLATSRRVYALGVNNLTDGVNKIGDFYELCKYINRPDLLASHKVIHRVFHYVPNPDPEFKTLVLGSDRIGLMIYERLQKQLKAERRKLMEWLDGAGKASVLAGWLFENLAHESLLKGGSFRLRQLGAEESVTECALGIDPTVGDYERISSRVDLKEVFRNVYHIPDAPNFKSIDSFKIVDGQLLLFQITRSAVHPVNSFGLVQLFTKLTMTEVIAQNPTKACMIFVVPKGMGETYRKQGLTGTAGDNWSSADVTIVKGIGKNLKQRLNQLGVRTCEELIKHYNEDPESISFVKGATETFLGQVDATYLDAIPQYVMELEK